MAVPVRTCQRLSTSCAHRLRKPGRMCEPLTPCVARRLRRATGSLTRAFEHPEGRPPARRNNDATRRATPRQARWDRRRVRAADTERTRAPSVGWARTSRRGRAISRLLFTRTTFAPHPVACCKSDPPRQRPASHLRLSRRSMLQVAPQRGLTGKMRLTNFCNRLTKRAPSGLSDSRAHRPTDLAAPRLVPTCLRPKTSGRSSGGGSLDGDTPASA
jgi:hypothetical protein